MEFNPFDYGFHRDPYPTYEWLRERAPVYHNERMDFWALSRFDDVLAGLHDPATYTSTRGVAIEHTDAALKSMIEMDPPQHTQMRKLIARRFTPRRIADLEPRGPRVDEHAARFDSRGARSSTSCASSPRCCPRRSSAPCSASRRIGTTTPADGPTTCSRGSRGTRCRHRRPPRAR